MTQEKESNNSPLQGLSIAPGVAMGTVHLKEYDLGKVPTRRVPNERVEEELNRFRAALEASRKELLELKTRMKGQLAADEARIFDTHLAYLKDPIFVADVENLILAEQMNLEAAVAKVISDFDRIFKLVESEFLRERAVDLRDVAIRVLRNLGAPGTPGATPGPSRYILVAKELSISDLFHLSGGRVEGIIAEEGGVTSHAAILARSMKIPTVIGIKGLLAKIKDGDTALVDGTEGVVRLNPDEAMKSEYGLGGDGGVASEGEIDSSWAERPATTRDGVAVQLFASCSNLAEVEQAAALKMDGVGLYRTELLFMVDRNPPTEDQLVQHYRKVAETAGSNPAVFRLLDLDSSMRRRAGAATELNPALGVKSLRQLLRDPATLRAQMRALLRVALVREIRILVPFVAGPEDLKRVKEILFEERWELKKGGLDLPERIPLGVSIEVPAATLLIRDLVREADFLEVALDNLIQYTLAADRSNEGVRELFSRMHPAILRMLRKVFEVAEAADLETFVMGETVAQPEFLPFLLGVGARRFSIAPVALPGFKRALGDCVLRDCRKLAAEAVRAPSPADLEHLLQRFQRES